MANCGWSGTRQQHSKQQEKNKYDLSAKWRTVAGVELDNDTASSRRKINTTIRGEMANCGWSEFNNNTGYNTKRTMVLKTSKTCRIFVIINTKTRSDSRRNCGWSDATTTTQETKTGKYADRLEMFVRNMHDNDVLT
jgi:hypothetical protein